MGHLKHPEHRNGVQWRSPGAHVRLGTAVPPPREPSSSVAAHVLSAVTGVLIFASMIVLVVEPIISGSAEEQSSDERNLWLGIEIFFTAIFTLELLLRAIASNWLGLQTLKSFIATPRNICDIVAILPLYFDLLFNELLRHFQLLRVVRLVRLIRLARFARLARLSKQNALAGPVAMCLVVTWGIYLQYHEDY